MTNASKTSDKRNGTNTSNNDLSGYSFIEENEVSGETPQKQHKPSNNNKKESLWQKWCAHDIGARAQIILAFLTLATLVTYIIINIYQSFKTRDAIAENSITNMYTKESLKKANIANSNTQKALGYTRIADSLAKEDIGLSRQSINFTRQSDSISEEFRKTELRAYVSIKEGKMDVSFKKNSFDGHILLENTGRTPAKRVRFVWRPKFNRNHVYFTDFETLRRYDTTYGCNLSPGVPFNLEITGTQIAAMDSLSIVNRKSKFFIYGLLMYDDIFRESHKIKYGLIYDPKTTYFYYEDIEEPEK